MRPGAETALSVDQTLTQDATGTLVMLELEAPGLGLASFQPPPSGPGCGQRGLRAGQRPPQLGQGMALLAFLLSQKLRAPGQPGRTEHVGVLCRAVREDVPAGVQPC